MTPENKVLISMKLFLRTLKLQFQFVISNWNLESRNGKKKNENKSLFLVKKLNFPFRASPRVKLENA